VTLAAWRGHEADASELIEASRRDVLARGEGVGITVTQWANAVLHNGLGQHDAALAAAEDASAFPEDSAAVYWAIVELVEAAARTGTPGAAADAHRRLVEAAHASGTDWALGLERCSRALLSDDGPAERLYREAIERLRRTRMRVYAARAHLLYGEWLRRGRRRQDARAQLRTAHEMFTAMGIEAFGDRAARELRATGETARARSAATADRLTAQERQIARLARDGLSNPEIGARLFLSPRTVEWHLRKVFAKLGIRSRIGLRTALPSADLEATPV